MSFPRMLAGLVAGLLALSGLSVSPSSAQDAQRPVVGAVFGDSFASGEGLAGIDLGEAECQRALGRTAGNGDPSTAWGVTVLGDLPVQSSWFAACTGARSEHFTKTPQRTGLWPHPVRRDQTQYAEAVDGTGTKRFDVVLASFGGNDLEFNKVIIDCIGIDDALVGAAQGARAGGWAGAAAGGAAGFLTGRCQPGTDQDRREAIDRLAEENLPELYNDLVGATTEGALIVVTGYPQLFEDPTTSWLQANALTRRCHGMHFDDADMMRGLAGRLNQAIGAEVKEAAKRHPGRTWVFADVSFPFDGHGLCSDRAEPWINGITTGLFDGDFRYKRSFHPNQDGHTKGYAGFIAGFRQVEEWQPPPAPVSPSAKSDPGAVCRAIEERLVRRRDDALWDELLGHLGSDPWTYPASGGDVLLAPDKDEPLVIFVSSATQESIQQYSVEADGRIDGPHFVYGGAFQGTQEGTVPDLTGAVQVISGQTGMSVESDGTIHCTFRF